MAAGLELTDGDGHQPPNDWVLAAMRGGNAGASDDGDAQGWAFLNAYLLNERAAGRIFC